MKEVGKIRLDREIVKKKVGVAVSRCDGITV
jgi:hypothetical protein